MPGWRFGRHCPRRLRPGRRPGHGGRSAPKLARTSWKSPSRSRCSKSTLSRPTQYPEVFADWMYQTNLGVPPAGHASKQYASFPAVSSRIWPGLLGGPLMGGYGPLAKARPYLAGEPRPNAGPVSPQRRRGFARIYSANSRRDACWTTGCATCSLSVPETVWSGYRHPDLGHPNRDCGRNGLQD